MLPADRHFVSGVSNSDAAQLSSEIIDQASAVVIGEPILQVMEARQIFSSAFAAAITIQFDVMEQRFRRPVYFRLIEHAREAECDLEKSPAIHAVKIR